MFPIKYLVKYLVKYLSGIIVPLIIFLAVSGDILGAPGQGAPEQFTAGPTFGSQSVLEACWTQEELRGRPNEKKTGRPAASDQTIPVKDRPEVRPTPLPREWHNCIRRVNPGHRAKAVALTFDLCQGPHGRAGYDAEIVDYLRQHQIKATFFAGGKWMVDHPERTMQLMADPLFELGNHTWSHANLRVSRGKKIEDEIIRTQVEYELLRQELVTKSGIRGVSQAELDKIPRRIMVFRFPYGACDAESLSVTAKLGLAAIQWDVVTGDPDKSQSAHNIVEIILNRTRPGSIIIGHANGRGHGTAEALPVVIPELQRRGYTFVTVSELLRLGQAVATEECYELTPGDNYRYDRSAGREVVP
ncbi:MAG: polysaccharide deacetylase family protein [Deltaproteobacteria bacterium]|nr:polysaccharide deacetylase family protein [Deltaproteobacteria bacterium]